LIVSDILVMIIFGFPAIFLSLLLSVIGVLKEKVWLVLIGAILFVPFSYYLSGSPGLAGIPIVLPGFQVGSAMAVREKNRRWAWLLLVPAFCASLWIVGVALFANFVNVRP
jgi:hypothetical protein